MTDYICPECGEECKAVAIDDSFDYAGTHCTGGRSGTHHVAAYYVSDCCEELLEDYEHEDEEGPDYDEPDGWDEGE